MSLTDMFGGSQKIDILTGPQKGLISKMAKRTGQEFGQPGEVYQGPGAPARDALMRGAYTQAAGGGFGVDPAYRQALSPALSGAQDPELVRQTYQSALQPAQLDFQRTLQDVGARYGDTWGSSGALPEMLSRATADYGGQLNQLLGQLTYNDIQGARDRQLQAVPTGLGLEQAENNAIGSLYGMGEANRAVTEQQNASEYAKWQAGQWYNNPALQFIAPTLGTQTSAMGTQPGLLSSIFNPAGFMAG